ncbi:hypothetical protein CQW23_13956, partial [Capsicum baccatum]
MRRIVMRKSDAIILSFDILRPSSSAVRPYSLVKGKVGLRINVDNEVKCLDDAVNLFNRMIRMNPLPSVIDFSNFFKTMINMKHYSVVVSLFQEMRILGIPISDSILSNSGVLFSGVTFTSLIRGLFAEHKLKNAVELFKKVARDNICELDEVMYATVMNGLSKRGHTKKTLSLLRLMEQGSTKPNVFIYSIVIDALCKDRNLDAAINLMNEMKQKGIPPDILTYGSVIDGLYVCTFNMVIDGLCKEGKVEDAEEVMEHMIKKGVEPDIITFNAIMDGYGLRGQVDRARRIFDIMIDKCIEPAIISYNVLINGYRKKKKVAKAMQLLGEISQRGSKPNTVPYTSILQGLFEVERTGDAKRVYAEMLSAGPKPNICTHSTVLDGYFRVVINGLCKMVNWMKLILFLRNFLSSDCLRTCSKFSEMETFMKEMADRGFSFDASTAALLVAAGQIANAGMVALSYVQRISEKVSLASEFTYNYMSRDVTASFGYNYILLQVVAIGECGLDYDRLHFCRFDIQKKCFEKQFELAYTTKLPMFLHMRAAAQDFCDILQRNEDRFVAGVAHSFTGCAEDSDKLLSFSNVFI